MKAQVQLPADPLIHYWLFCKAIAQAICPASEQELKGVDCIEGKLVTHYVPMATSMAAEEKWSATAGLQSVLLSDDGSTLDQLCLERSDAAASSTHLLPLGDELHHEVVELTLPYKLTDDDRRLMEKLLADLPALHYPMSEDEMATFMNAYFNLANRPAWEPVLVTATTIERRKAEQDMVLRLHQQALQDELAYGRLVAVNTNHIPAAKLAIDSSFLQRDQAIAYLDRCGISHCDRELGSHHDVEIQLSATHQEPLEGKQGAVGERKLSDQDKREIVDLHKELERKGVKNFTKQVAEKYGVSDSYIRRLMNKAKDKQNAGWTDSLGIKNR